MKTRVDESEKDLNLIENEGHGKEEPSPQEVKVEVGLQCQNVQASKSIDKNFLFKLILQENYNKFLYYHWIQQYVVDSSKEFK